jgi:hypothetical protein
MLTDWLNRGVLSVVGNRERNERWVVGANPGRTSRCSGGRGGSRGVLGLRRIDAPILAYERNVLQQIPPLLAKIPTSAIRSRIGVSRWYAGRIREGYRPHPRHWLALAELAGVAH